MHSGYKFKKPSVLACLTREQVKRARLDYAAGKATQEELAKRLGISQKAVSMFLRGTTYKWVGHVKPIKGVKAA